MAEPSAFQSLLHRARGGDEAALTKLWEEYGPQIESVMRARLRNSRPLRHVSASDILQSAFRRFYVDLRCGELTINDPKHMLNLLLRIARHRLLDHQRRHEPGEIVDRAGADRAAELAASGPSPPSILGRLELGQKIETLLTAEERDVLTLIDQHCTWEQVAAQLGGTAEGRRKQWERTRKRVREILDP